ncbi:hypothetical protein [Morganella psychrotolerans]|uniref:hypothetical protein n=1 Tax=Morganella psychrotolerans TaxID=368603 RepID=UPI0039AF313C
MVTSVTFSQAAKEVRLKSKEFTKFLLMFGLIKSSGVIGVCEFKKSGRKDYETERYKGRFIINSRATPRKVADGGSIPQQHLDERIIPEFIKYKKMYDEKMAEMSLPVL